MPVIAINFSDTNDLIPDGKYSAMIDSVELRSKKDDLTSQYLNWQFTITDGPYAGRRVWMVTGLSERSHWVVAKTFKNLGVLDAGDELVLEIDDESLVLMEPDVIGLSCTLDITTEVYNGQKRNRVSVSPPAQSDTRNIIF